MAASATPVEPGVRPGIHPVIAYHFTSGASGRRYPHKIYNNTLIINTAVKEIEHAIRIAHAGGEAQNDGVDHEVYNNILMVWGDELWNNRNGEGRDEITGGFALDGTSTEKYDHNHYVRVLSYSPAVSPIIRVCYDHHVRVGGPYNFTSGADLRSSAANLINAEANGTDAQSVGVGAAGMNTAAANPFVNCAGYDFHVKGGNTAKTGAKNLSATGWPGSSNITANSERGAYGGGSTQIGPRISVLNY